MRTRILLSLFAGILSLGAVATSAEAGVPGWSRSERQVRLDVFTCQISLAQAIQDVTGVAPTTTKFDNNNYELRGFIGNIGIFAYCSASPVNICPGRPQANITILAFSSSGSLDANAKRSDVDLSLGNPQLIDCN